MAPSPVVADILNALSTPTAHPDDTSEAKLRRLERFAGMMDKTKLGFLYDRWRNHPACQGKWSEKAWGDGEEERTEPGGGLYKLKIISWGMMTGARGRLDQLTKAAHGIDAAIADATTKLAVAWDSKAGENAVTKINEMKAATASYNTMLTQLRDHLAGASTATNEVIEKLANFADQSDGGKPLVEKYAGLGGNSDGDTDSVSRAQYSTYMDEMWKIVNTGDDMGVYRNSPSKYEKAEDHDYEWDHISPSDLRTPGRVELEEGDDRWSNEICNDLDDLCNLYQSTIRNFRQRVTQTVDAVIAAWTQLSTNTFGDHDPYAKLSVLIPGDTGGKDPGGKDPGGKDPGGKDPGGKNPGGGSQPGGNAGYQPPPMPKPGDLDGDGKPDNPGDANMDGKPDNPGDLNMDGKPDNPGDKDGDGKPDNPADKDGDGKPDDPSDLDGDGKPDSLVQGPGTPETVKITEGDRTIEVASPDGQGHVKVTVDDGTGNPKTYDLDFATAAGLADGSTAIGPDGRPVTADGQPAAFGPSGPGSTVGPDGKPLSAEAGVEHVQAGPDGKAVIQDGPLTITAERDPGAPDTVIVTVDDGSGKSTTYTLDYAESAAGAQPVTGSSTPGVNGGPADLGAPVGASAAGAPASAGVAGGPASMGAPGDSGGNGPASAGSPGGSSGQGAAFTGSPVGSPDSGFQAGGHGPVEGATYAASVDSGVSQAWGAAGNVFDGGAEDPSSTDSSAAGPGEAGLSSAQSTPGGDHASQPGSAVGGGMPMGGGMAGGGGGGGGGGDQERSGSQWRTTGTLFDDDYLETQTSMSSIDGGN
ncbi:hypothetical protein [Actinokineospora xionganensis]|uniref:WXG100 family type VII secretion target n=1 Tax=Actinokineospora xionganensis TaxID=2684470 RepID=A0ABR7L1H7_9PSEU|nr:hypothetical protein [Actinokineospora xionganensis]MBC6446314.1 hypothetical protein [Actinokineospora xionganensis]